LRQSQTVVAGLRVLWTDEPVWGPRPADAAYVHGLVIDRGRAGNGIGAALLTWAEDRTNAVSRSFLRLDCVQGNLALRSYYARAGFREVGRRELDGPWQSVVLLEKQLA
jgi:GNAT superfamily N-acetyltransferase